MRMPTLAHAYIYGETLAFAYNENQLVKSCIRNATNETSSEYYRRAEAGPFRSGGVAANDYFDDCTNDSAA